jgi:hypothetical protein
VLKSEIALNSVKTDGTVSSYTKEASSNAPGDSHLRDSRIHFQKTLLLELVDFTNIKTRLFYCKKLAEDHHSSVSPQLAENLNSIKTLAEKEVYAVAESFKKQILGFVNQEELPEENAALQERINKACNYFGDKLLNQIYRPVQKLNIDSDNKTVRASIKEAFDNLLKETFIKLKLLTVCCDGFKTFTYLQTKANAEIDYSTVVKDKPAASQETPQEIAHKSLFITLKNWRNNLANETNVPVYIILPQKALIELVNTLPSSSAELESIKGIGKMKVQRYGKEILEMVDDYCRKHNIQRNPGTIRIKEEKVKVYTRKVSFDLFKEGKSIAEIAQLRNFSPVTIEGHLSTYISTGEISVFDLVSKIKVAKIMAYLVQHPGLKHGEIKAALGDEISYGELKAVMNHLNYVNAEVV